jgi:general nucleoside transport system ATP-binding protein
MVNICKRFNTISANDNINLNINSGEILALVGENGAGKTTLMNILYGIYQPDSGRIIINGKQTEIKTPRRAISLGISMVHQHFMLIQNHTVSENILLGLPGIPFMFSDRIIKNKMDEVRDKYNLNINPSAKIWQLSAGEKQKIEIVKSILRGADLLILDEPTSILAPQETDELFSMLSKLANAGHSIIIITHKIHEIKKISDRVAVLRQGKLLGNVKTSETGEDEIVRLMIGEEKFFHPEKKDVSKGESILRIENICVKNDKNIKLIKDLSFELYKNEILGIAGISGNGQKELVEAIFGLRKIEKGKILYKNNNIENTSPKSGKRSGISYIPEERNRYGILPDSSLYDNAILNNYDKKEFSNSKFLNNKHIEKFTDNIIDTFKVETKNFNIPIRNLSGGNIQKFILGREILGNPELIIASHPTYGLDIRSTKYIRDQLLQMKDLGAAVLLVSEDLEEIFEISDRIAVMFNGEFTGMINHNDIDINQIGAMMTGTRAVPIDVRMIET